MADMVYVYGLDHGLMGAPGARKAMLEVKRPNLRDNR